MSPFNNVLFSEGPTTRIGENKNFFIKSATTIIITYGYISLINFFIYKEK